MSAPGTCHRLLLVAFVCSAPWATAHAHIGPSVRANNRYLKLTLQGNQARLLYTFYLGEVPGRQARRRMDADRDGVISRAEARVFGDEIAATIAAGLELDVDGTRVAVSWASIDVGLGTDTVNAGAFSVDLVRWLCFPSPADTLSHTVRLFDHWRPPQPGETEVRVEESPGVTVTQSRLGADNPRSQLRFKWIDSRPPHALDTDGLHVALTVDPREADVEVAASCAPPAGADAASGTRTARWPLYAVVAGALFALALVLLVIERRTGSSR